jgi:transcriptional regulator with XRE-family HTH domain
MTPVEPTTPIRTIRQQRGLSVDALAVLVGRNKSTVSRIERGLIEPKPETVIALASALGISASRARRLTAGRPSVFPPAGAE